MIAEELAARLSHMKRHGKWYNGPCPAHDDQHDSFGFCDGDRGVIVTCHAGCTIEHIAAALELKVSDFFFDSPPRNGQKCPKETAYDYRDEHGELLYQEVRLSPKGFKQRRPDGKGGWIYNLDGVRRVLYRLPNLQAQQIVHSVEGGKDADRLWKLGLPATTNSGGAGKWSDDLTKQLKAAGVERVILVQDNDLAGEAHTQDVGRSCLTHGLTVTRIRLPGLPPLRNKHGEDISDWLDAGHSKDELLAVIAATPAVAGPDGPHLTDMGNAQRFVLQHHSDIRFCVDGDTWWVWDKIRWQRDREQEIIRRAKHTTCTIYGEAPFWPAEAERKKVAIWATQSEAEKRLRAMVSLARSEPSMAITASVLDANLW